MKGVSKFLLFLIFALNFGQTFLIQSQHRPTPSVPAAKRKLSFMDIFTKKQTATVTSIPSSSSSSDSVNKVMQLLQLADSFTNDPNFNVNVQVNYRNDPNNSGSPFAKARQLRSNDDSETLLKTAKSKTTKQQKKNRKNTKTQKISAKKISKTAKNDKSKANQKKKSI